MIVELGIAEMKNLVYKPEQLSKIIDEAIQVSYNNTAHQ
jgi:hypothetical protein